MALAFCAAASSGCSNPPGAHFPSPWSEDVGGATDAGDSDADAGDSDAGDSDAGESPDVDTRQRTRIDIFGPTELIQDLETQQLDLLDIGIDAEAGTAYASYQSVGSADWSSAFTFVNRHGDLTSLTIHPWLCLRRQQAIDSVKNGYSATESRTVELDASGTFWTNGRWGFGFPSECEWFLSPSMFAGTLIPQDGPSFCTEEKRRGTRFEVLDSEGNVLSTPETCAAFVQRVPDDSSPVEIALSLSLVRTADSAEGVAFTFNMKHCLRADQWPPPFVLDDADSWMPDGYCPFNGASLTVGMPVSGKPPVYTLAGGAWNVYAASTDPAGVHVSQVDILLTGSDEKSFTVRGYIELPQFLW
jgi:hypothetical protein